jgi:phosphate transport system substrate-binding protein
MVHLCSTWAEEYMKANPGVEVPVTGGGSGTGIAALINGTTDIAAASREMKQKEKDKAAAGGARPVEFVVARDGIAVVVNPENPVSELTMEELKKIFTGAYENWLQVGGPDEGILVLSRESSSGTYVFFKDHVLKKQDYAVTARLMPATSAIVQSVASDRWAIGYVGLGYAVEAGDKVKTVLVKADEEAPAVEPSEETVMSGEYPIARPLHLYTLGEPRGAAKAFIDFALGPEGQRIVRETGYVAVR